MQLWLQQTGTAVLRGWVSIDFSDLLESERKKESGEGWEGGRWQRWRSDAVQISAKRERARRRPPLFMMYYKCKRVSEDLLSNRSAREATYVEERDHQSGNAGQKGATGTDSERTEVLVAEEGEQRGKNGAEEVVAGENGRSVHRVRLRDVHQARLEQEEDL